jgi:hypothetical protein
MIGIYGFVFDIFNSILYNALLWNQIDGLRVVARRMFVPKKDYYNQPCGAEGRLKWQQKHILNL